MLQFPKLSLFPVVAVLLLSLPAQAAPGPGPQLPLAGGIASPSGTSAVFENPAGLLENPRFRGQALGTSEGNGLNETSLGAGLFGSTSPRGAGVGVGALVNRLSGSPELRVGVALGLDALPLRAGVSATLPLSGGAGGISLATYGFQYLPSSDWTWGLQLDREAKNMGLGFSKRMSGAYSLGIDSSLRLSDPALRVKPGFSADFGRLQLALAYGIAVGSKSSALNGTDSGGSAFFGNGLSGGIGLALTQPLRLEFLYQQFAKYSASLTFEL